MATFLKNGDKNFQRFFFNFQSFFLFSGSHLYKKIVNIFKLGAGSRTCQQNKNCITLPSDQ